jgi:hypothetical protein
MPILEMRRISLTRYGPMEVLETDVDMSAIVAAVAGHLGTSTKCKSRDIVGSLA